MMAMNDTGLFVSEEQIDACLKAFKENDIADTKLIEQIANLYFQAFRTSGEGPGQTQEELSNTISAVFTQSSLLPEGWSLPDLRDSRYDIDAIRADFPILSEKIDGNALVWLDNAATTQKPKCVIERLTYFYEHENSNVHRGAHTLAARATDAYEEAREKVRRFLNASSSSEIIFLRGATEAINLIAQAYGKANIGEGDEVLISCLEHHANIVPWQMLCAEKGARLRVIPIDGSGQVDLDEYARMLGPKTKVVSLAHVSNALGTIVPVGEMAAAAHRFGAKVVVDGAQAISHIKADVQALDADFYVFSGHKVYGPTGIGVLYGKLDILNQMAPYHGGGNMIRDVTFEKTRYQAAPRRFEAGTGNIADAVALGTAIDYVSRTGMDAIREHEQSLLEYGQEELLKIPGIRLFGCAKEKTGILSFTVQGVSNEKIGRALNAQGIAVRAGHHCAQPVLRRLGTEGTVRASLAMYNTKEELDKMAWVLKNEISGH